jgi:hypothetical protein
MWSRLRMLFDTALVAALGATLILLALFLLFGKELPDSVCIGFHFDSDCVPLTRMFQTQPWLAVLFVAVIFLALLIVCLVLVFVVPSALALGIACALLGLAIGVIGMVGPIAVLVLLIALPIWLVFRRKKPTSTGTQETP